MKGRLKVVGGSCCGRRNKWKKENGRPSEKSGKRFRITRWEQPMRNCSGSTRTDLEEDGRASDDVGQIHQSWMAENADGCVSNRPLVKEKDKAIWLDWIPELIHQASVVAYGCATSTKPI